MKRQKRMLTLLEVLIALTLLFSFTTVVGISTYRWIQKGRYTSDVRRAASLLQTAQNMALLEKGHVHVVFSNENGIITMHCQPQVHCPPAFCKKYVKQKIPLKTVRTLLHNGNPLAIGENWIIKFNRYDGAFRMAGTLSFSPKAEAKEEECLHQIALKNYPAPIFPLSASSNPVEEQQENLLQRLYPEWVLDKEGA